jgi:hypothetical protein
MLSSTNNPTTMFEVDILHYVKADGNIAIQLYDDGMPFDKPTINPDVTLAKDEIALHPAPYHKEAIDFLTNNGYIGTEVLRMVRAGNYSVEVRKLLKFE